MKTIDDYNFKNKRALIRVDFNVPIDDGKVGDANRIEAAVPTIKKILNDGGSVVLMSHLGRPKDNESKYSLEQIVGKVSEVLGTDVKFVNNFTRINVPFWKIDSEKQMPVYDQDDCNTNCNIKI